MLWIAASPSVHTCVYVRWVYAVGEQVESLEDMSDRSRAGSRCFERILMCRPYSIWFQSPGREWHAKLKYGTLGQEVPAAILPLLPLLLLLLVPYLFAFYHTLFVKVATAGSCRVHVGTCLFGRVDIKGKFSTMHAVSKDRLARRQSTALVCKHALDAASLHTNQYQVSKGSHLNCVTTVQRHQQANYSQH